MLPQHMQELPKFWMQSDCMMTSITSSFIIRLLCGLRNGLKTIGSSWNQVPKAEVVQYCRSYLSRLRTSVTPFASCVFSLSLVKRSGASLGHQFQVITPFNFEEFDRSTLCLLDHPATLIVR